MDADEARKVIWVNFKGHKTERDFCARHNARDLSGAVRKSEKAAMELLSTVARYKSDDPEYLSGPIEIAILAGREKLEFFMKNPHRFKRVMAKVRFEDTVCAIVKNDVALACYLLSHPEKFKWVGGYKRAKAIADEAIRKSNEGFAQGRVRGNRGLGLSA